MANEAERRGYYKQGYYKLLDQLNVTRLERPEFYDYFAEEVNRYRDWVLDVAEIADLPDVPKK